MGHKSHKWPLWTLSSLLKLASSLFLSFFQGCRESMHVSLSFVACIYELHEYVLTQYKETSTPNQNGNNLYNLLSRITSKLNSHCHFHGACITRFWISGIPYIAPIDIIVLFLQQAPPAWKKSDSILFMDPAHGSYTHAKKKRDG